MIEPHFHKDYKIEEKDLVPNGDFVTVVPDWPAPEGTKVHYLSGTTYRLYIMIDGTWRQVGGSSGGWELVTHAAVSGASNFTISNLAGDTDKLYKLIVKGYFSSSETTVHLRLNGDTGSNYHYSAHRQGLVSNADNHSQTSSGALTNNKEAYALLYDGSCKEFFMEMLIDAQSGFVRKAQGKLTTYTDGDTWFQSDFLGIWSNTADEVTSVKITAGQNFLSGSEYWFYKAVN